MWMLRARRRSAEQRDPGGLWVMRISFSNWKKCLAEGCGGKSRGPRQAEIKCGVPGIKADYVHNRKIASSVPRPTEFWTIEYPLFQERPLFSIDDPLTAAWAFRRFSPKKEGRTHVRPSSVTLLPHKIRRDRRHDPAHSPGTAWSRRTGHSASLMATLLR